MTLAFLETLLPKIEPIVAFASNKLLQAFQSVSSTTKQDGSLVTEADLWADQYFRTTLQENFPDFGILTEEVVTKFPSQEWCWVIDPLDGTTNFTRGIPLWAISIGLLYQGQPVWGYIAVPPLQQNFYGYLWENDQKSLCNDRILKVSSENLTSNHLVSFCSRSLTAIGNQDFSHLFKLRMLGVASYNLLTVATGATLAAVEATPKIWDIAAVWVILRAAGAQWQFLNYPDLFPITPNADYHHRSLPTVVASSPAILEAILPLVSSLT